MFIENIEVDECIKEKWLSIGKDDATLIEILEKISECWWDTEDNCGASILDILESGAELGKLAEGNLDIIMAKHPDSNMDLVFFFVGEDSKIGEQVRSLLEITNG